MRHIGPTFAAVVAVAVALTACGSTDNSGNGSGGPTVSNSHSGDRGRLSPSDVPTTDATSSTSDGGGSQTLVPGGIPTPNDAQRAALLAGLAAVDPSLVTDPDQAVTRSRTACQQVNTQDGISATVAVARDFSASGTSVDASKAGSIIDVLRQTFCPAP